MPIWLAATYIGTASIFLAVGLVLYFVGRLLGKRRVRATSKMAEEIHALGKRVEVKKARDFGDGEPPA
jgi:hypothetical protein